jgi:HEAT repeat protein
LLRVITAYPRLGKEAAQALKDLGDAIKDVASVTEVQGLIAGTLSKDLSVRKAALEALQPVDITELDYSEEIWIAVHDADEQNASLALHLWDDNGLDLPETFLASLLGYLAHESSAVRISTAGALAEAVQAYPAQTEKTVVGLQEMYADKARFLQPEFDRFVSHVREFHSRHS